MFFLTPGCCPLTTVIAAYILDLSIGDPQWRWHPVRCIGKLIESLERRLSIDNGSKLFSGTLLVIVVVGLTCFSAWLMLELAKLVHPVVYWLVSVLLIYFSLSVKCLADEAGSVYNSLRAGDIAFARRRLSMIVGRDTDKLESPEIIRAAVETIAESAMDGVIAPLFYVFLGGPVLAWLYKAVNTLDSMVGYKNQRFLEFGRASARLDGLINIIPARITSFLIAVSSWFCALDWRGSFRQFARYFFKDASYNSIITEAALAGSLGVRLGGVNYYNSVPETKLTVGDGPQPLRISHIKDSIRIMYISSVLFLLIGLCLL